MGLGALALAMVACSPAPEKTATGDTKKEGEADAIRVGLVFDKGGKGDKSFNDSAYAGLERAEKELGITSSTLNSPRDADYEQNLRKFADEGMDLVVAIGINMGSAVDKVAPDYPNTKFAIVDAPVEQPNVRSLTFSEEQGSFLVGYLAGLMTKTNKVGFVGGQELDLIKKFEVGFAAGAKTANPKVEFLPAKYTGAWDNVDTAKQAAVVLFNQGADIVYHAAGRAGLGVIAAAKDKGEGFYAIGVDSDQDGLEPGRVLTSMIKGVDAAVFQTIKDVVEGKFSPGTVVYDIGKDGVGYSPLTHTKDAIGPEKIAQLEAMRDKLKAGEVKVPATKAEYEAYLKTLASN